MENTEQFTDAFGQDVQRMQDFGFDPYPPRMHIAIPHARERLAAGLRYYLGSDAKWLPAYDQVAEWLADNQRRGLLCVGTCGLGKTLICQNILPVLIYHQLHIVVKACSSLELSSQPDTFTKASCIIVDDIGIEPIESNSYGNRRVPFNELVYNADRQGSLLILTTNLRTNQGKDAATAAVPSIEGRYGLRTLDRLRAMTKVIRFEGPSMRK